MVEWHQAHEPGAYFRLCVWRGESYSYKSPVIWPEEIRSALRGEGPVRLTIDEARCAVIAILHNILIPPGRWGGWMLLDEAIHDPAWATRELMGEIYYHQHCGLSGRNRNERLEDMARAAEFFGWPDADH